jgi:hypothetical protein
LVSREHVHAPGSLNNGQLQSSADGSYTVVISAHDPGIKNWLDTGGLSEGGMFIRWQALTQTIDDPDARAIRSVKRIKLRDLHSELPVNLGQIGPAERAALLEQREASYKLRCGGIACEFGNKLR